MPSKYGKEFSVPKEFPSVLKSFTREVLRAQPGNIYEFGATYFTELLAQAEAAAAAEMAGSNRRLSRAELEELLTSMFQEADTDASGALSLQEFQTVLKMADLGLPDREAKAVMSEADVDGNGEISYSEFIPLAVDLVHNMYAKLDAEEQDAQAKADAERETMDLFHSMSKLEVEAIMKEIFMKSDADNSGALSLAEFQKCLKDADIGLTRKEINVLMHQCDVDNDGQISYDEFVPLCFEMLVEIAKSDLLAERKPATELEVFLKQVCEEADIDAIGVLSLPVLSRTLGECDLGLTRLQIHSVCSSAEIDEDGCVSYLAFAPKASEIIYRMLDMDAQIERANALYEIKSGGADFDLVHGYTQEQIIGSLRQEFAASDPSGSGLIKVTQVKAALAQSTLGFSPAEIASLLAAAEVQNDMCVYESICSYAFYILQYMAQEQQLQH